MDRQYATTSSSPKVLLDISGDLRIKGQDELEVVAKSSSPQDLSLESSEDQVIIRCTSDCSVRVPRAAEVHVQAARGDAVIKALEGGLAIDSVSGDLELRNVGAVKIGSVYGELTFKNIDGDLSAESISGDTSGRSIQGDFTISGSIYGNLNLSDVGGSAHATANGNISLRLDPSPGHDYEFNCNGNLFCRLSTDASAEISVPRASQVMVDLPGIRASAPVQTPYALTLGEGDAHITLSANGNVVLDTHAPNWEEDFDLNIDEEVSGMADAVSEQISQQVDSQVRMIEDQLNAQLANLTMRLNAAKLTADQARMIEERARETSLRAAERAQERVRHAQEKMEHKMAAAQRRMEFRMKAHERASRHAHRGWSFSGVSSAGSAAPAEEPVSEDERLIILRMLEQKKITMEEAEKLLSTLEDQGQ